MPKGNYIIFRTHAFHVFVLVLMVLCMVTATTVSNVATSNAINDGM